MRSRRLAFAAVVLASVTGPSLGGAVELPLPHLRVEPSAKFAPRPTSAMERTPLRLRLANSIRTDDGSLSTAAKEVTFKIDRHFHLDLTGVPRCPFVPMQVYLPFNWSRCENAQVAGGRIRWEIAYREREAFGIVAKVAVYKRNANQLTLHVVLPAPLAAEVILPIRVGRIATGVYGSRLVASIPKVSGGYGSLVYLGLAFRKGLFSATCPNRRIQFGVDDVFVDGARFSGAVLESC